MSFCRCLLSLLWLLALFCRCCGYWLPDQCYCFRPHARTHLSHRVFTVDVTLGPGFPDVGVPCLRLVERHGAHAANRLSSISPSLLLDCATINSQGLIWLSMRLRNSLCAHTGAVAVSSVAISMASGCVAALSLGFVGGCRDGGDGSNTHHVVRHEL